MTGWFSSLLRAEGWFDPLALTEGWFDQENIQPSGGAGSTAVTVAQAQDRQEQDGDTVTTMPVVGSQAQDPQQQDADAFTGIAAAVAQEQKRQEQDVDAEARDPLPSTDVMVAQDQAAQEQSAQAEAPTPPAASYGGGYYSTRVLPDTQRRREIKKARAKKPHGLTWPEKWPETTPEILPPLQVSIDCAVDQKQARQEQKILIKTAQGWEPFDYQPEAFKPEAIRLQPPPAPRRAPAWPAASSPIRRPAPVTRAIRKGPGGVSSKRESEEEELLVIIAASD
jgi:hypothetical protein